MIHLKTNTNRRIFFIFIATIVLFVTNWSELFIQRNQGLIGWGISRPLLFILINVHVIVIIGLLYQIIRQGIKLFTERAKKIPGSSFKKNLFFAFTLFSVIPAFFIFFSAGKFITTSIDDWFHARIEHGLISSLDLHKIYTQQERVFIKKLGTKALATIKKQHIDRQSQAIELERNVQLYVWSTHPKSLYKQTKKEVQTWRLFRQINDRTTKSLRKSLCLQLQKVLDEEIFDFYGSLYWVKKHDNQLIILTYRYPEHIRKSLIEIQTSLHDYQALKSMRNPIYTNYMYTFILITILILFLSIWSAFYLSRGISKPIQNLIQAIQRLKKGEWGIVVTPDPNSDLKSLETGLNEMSQTLKEMHGELEKKNKEMLAILENIKASVFFINTYGRIITYNQAAKELAAKYLGITRFKNKRINYFGKQVTTVFLTLVKKLNSLKKQSLSEEFSFTFNNERKELVVHMTIMKAQTNLHIVKKNGLLVVIEDITDVVRANKIKTWREAAKQMAHEIKNPLTPIQLATQRLQRKYKHLLQEEPIFHQCTQTILKQVSIVKNLTTHFSAFASMPTLNLEKVDINNIVEEVMRFYKISYAEIDFFYSLESNLNGITSDQQKIRRILINLLDNSVRALSSQKHKIIKVTTQHSSINNEVTITISDNGPGIDKAIKDTLFLPYVSSNKKIWLRAGHCS